MDENTPIDTPLAAFRVRHATRLDQHADSYPPHLVPTVLVQSLTLSTGFISRWGEDTRSLYANVRTARGSSALDTIRGQRRVIVLGDPGFGKSTILAALVTETNRSRRDGVAVYVRAIDIARFASENRGLPHASLPAAIGRYIVPAINDVLSSRESDAIEVALTTSSSSVLAIDGLDEVTDPNDSSAVYSLLRTLNTMAARVVLSSRFTGFRRPGGEWREYSVDYLDPDHAESFMEAWFQGQNPDGLSRALVATRSSDGVSELAQVPVVAGLIAFVAADRDVPMRISALYSEYLSLFLERRWRDQTVGKKRAHALGKTASEIAWYMSTGAPAVVPDGRRWTEQVRRSDLLNRLSGRTKLINQLIDVSGILVSHGLSSASNSRYRWLHRTLHEHLTGVRLAELVVEDATLAYPLLEDAVQFPTLWLVALQHMADALDNESRELVFARWAGMAKDADPGRVIVRAITGVFGVLPDLAARLAGKISDLLTDTQSWGELSVWDYSRCRDELSAAIVSADDPFVSGPSVHIDVDDLVLLGQSASGAPPEFHVELANFLGRRSAGSGEHLEALRTIERHFPTLAILAEPVFLQRERAPYEQLMHIRTGNAVDLEQADVEGLIETAETHPFPMNFHAVAFLLEQKREPDLRRRRTRNIGLAMFLWAHQAGGTNLSIVRDKDNLRDYARALSGECGELAEVVLALYVPSADTPTGEWAALGDRMRRLRRAGIEFEAPRATKRLGDMVEFDVSDPIQAGQVLDALVSLMAVRGSGDQDNLSALVNLWQRLSRLCGSRTYAPDSAADVAVRELLWLVDRLIGERDVQVHEREDGRPRQVSFQALVRDGGLERPLGQARDQVATGWRHWLGQLELDPDPGSIETVKPSSLLRRSLAKQRPPDGPEALRILKWAARAKVTDYRDLVPLIAEDLPLNELLRETQPHPNLLRHLAEALEPRGKLSELRSLLQASDGTLA